MTPNDQYNSILSRLKKLELSIATLYSIFALQSSQNNRKFWLDLSKMEKQHAVFIDRITELLQKIPLSFRALSIPPEKLVLRMQKSVDEAIDRSRSGHVKEETFIFIAYDIECSVLDNSIYELFESNDEEFLFLLKQIKEDTKKHRDMLLERIPPDARKNYTDCR